jgi:hypothetical protein
MTVAQSVQFACGLRATELLLFPFEETVDAVTMTQTGLSA